MGELLSVSQSSLLLFLHSPLCSSRRGRIHSNSGQPSLAVTSPMFLKFPTSHAVRKPLSHFISDSKVPTTFSVDSAGKGIDILPDSGGSDDNFGGGAGNGGGGGGRDNDGSNDKNESGSGGSEDQSGGHEKKEGMSMSQKITLGYAALVGIGGAIGYLKGGSKKSLAAGGLSASILCFVYTLLPSNPVLASSIGLVLSASLLGVMGSRFKKSGKIFPAGVVSFASLVMSGGYLHGILRSLH